MTDKPAGYFKFLGSTVVRKSADRTAAWYRGRAVMLRYEATFWEGGRFPQAPYRYLEKCETLAVENERGEIWLRSVGNTSWRSELISEARKALNRV